MTLIKVLCKACASPIYRDRGRINENIKLGHNFYCSRKCEFKYKTKRRILECDNHGCLKKFSRQPNDILAYNYCSRSCAATVNNHKFPKWKVPPRKCASNECGNLVSGGLKYCSEKCREGVRCRFTEKGLIETIQKIAHTLGRTPAKREATKIARACVYYFGAWNTAITQAGLNPNRSHSQRMYKRVMTKAKDGHPCDSISEAIVDNWLTDHAIDHIKDFPYPTTHHKADWSVGDIFIEYFGLAKDSPRYDRAVAVKRNFCQKHNIPLIEIYPGDIYPKVALEDKLRSILVT
ncbi:MAG: hypothetical protein G01um101433_612 [Parcubacteria group bacterium Gr01-1014_33]|nr:MAG: hypothetical protein G01um101433_612 [Parcubacteria group bacterium Gr01-1014_33]